MIYEKNQTDPVLFPALVLCSGIAKNRLGGSDESFPEGTCFFLTHDYVATAKHCGEMLRSHLANQGFREQGGVQAYGQHVFDPRLGVVWKVEEETPFKNVDISILKVAPDIEENEDASPYIPWLSVWDDIYHADYPVVRMFAVQDGEYLSLRGFTDIEFELTDGNDPQGRSIQNIDATGIFAEGHALWQEITGSEGKSWRLTIEGVAAKGQNSGSPVFDEDGRIIGVVSISPQEGYTVVAPFFEGQAAPSGGGRHLTKLLLNSDEIDGKAICVMCDYGSA